MEDLLRNLGVRIRELRSQAGFTQESFADTCGLHRNYVGAIERGEQNLTVKTLQIVARNLNTTIASLFVGIG